MRPTFPATYNPQVSAKPSDLATAARLRSEIATLARGGEYGIAIERLCALAAVDLRAGLTADALLRSRQAAALARSHDNREAELRAELVLAVGLYDAGEALEAERTTDSVLTRIGDCAEDVRPPLAAVAYLIRGIASRHARHLDGARVALDQARQRAVRLGRADLSAPILTELGVVELLAGDPAAAAVCFRFAREAYLLLGRGEPAAAAAVMALAAFLDAGRVEEALALAGEALAQAAADPVATARIIAAQADALVAAGDLDRARVVADDAAVRARELPEAVRRELGVAGRLRQLRLERDLDRQRFHLEAAVDLGLVASDGPALARALDGVVADLVTGALPAAAWDLVAALGQLSRGLGLTALAHLADVAASELR